MLTKKQFRERDVSFIPINVMVIRYQALRVNQVGRYPDDMDAFTELLWNSLNADNKVSLFVRYIDIATGTYNTKIVNKNQ